MKKTGLEASQWQHKDDATWTCLVRLCRMGAEGGKMRVGRPKKTRQDTTNEDLKEMGLDWKDASSVAGDHTSGGLSSLNVSAGT